VQHAREALKEQEHSKGTAEQELAAERRLDASALELATAMMGAEEGGDDRDQDDSGQLGEVALREDGGKQSG
jgi:hypothetical protein